MRTQGSPEAGYDVLSVDAEWSPEDSHPRNLSHVLPVSIDGRCDEFSCSRLRRTCQALDNNLPYTKFRPVTLE